MKNRVIKMLISSRTSLGLMSGILCYIIAAVYLSQVTGDGQSLYGHWWFAAALSGLALSIVVCSLTRAVRLYRGSGKEQETGYGRRLPQTKETLTSSGPGEIEARMRRKGFKLHPVSERIPGDGEWLQAVKNPFSPWGSVVFHLGLTVILAGFGVSSIFGMSGDVMIPEGVAVRFPDDLSITAQGPFYSAAEPYLVGLREFTVSKVDGEISQVRGILDFMLGDYRNPYPTEINKPARHDGHYWRIKDYGYSAHLVIRDKSGNTVIDDYANIGKTGGRHHDEFPLPDGSKFTIDFLEPDPAGRAGQADRQAGPARAALRIVFAQPGEAGVLAAGTVHRGAEGDIGDYRVSFPEYRYWSLFDVSKDSGEPLVYLGGLMAAAGLAWRGCFIRKRVWLRFAAESGDTLVYWSARADYFSRLFENEVRELLDNKGGSA
ncbi:cytochrome c biogenesis protein ResB [Phosphitispora fastidiosa]|uniref:cytochrome c biogenesis protein ResB n=1 Tax=Phosphitispora fastidiosa TaxID=2837202 RepID=UPI001E39662C|nr:cytochrome c biogenesis protein ResB [Phosphitispora fastidiosa]MBU7008037.1 cytochrome c biogenesis protein ResB [Phosphitispora fastidiosa]